MAKKIKPLKKLPKLGTYKGRFKVTKPEKYIGDHKDVIYRSNWEKQAFKYCEDASWIQAWGSEITVVPYICETDKRPHRYFVDLTIVTQKGEVILVEIKPHKQTKAPKVTKKTKYALNEVATYIKNDSKWKAARAMCEHKNTEGGRTWRFEIWTENELKKLGLKI